MDIKPKIFEKLKKIKLGKGNEFQLTDAIQELISSGEKVLAIPLLDKEKVLDVGTVESYMASQITSFRYVWFLISSSKNRIWRLEL